MIGLGSLACEIPPPFPTLNDYCSPLLCMPFSLLPICFDVERMWEGEETKKLAQWGFLAPTETGTRQKLSTKNELSRNYRRKLGYRRELSTNFEGKRGILNNFENSKNMGVFAHESYRRILKENEGKRRKLHFQCPGACLPDIQCLGAGPAPTQRHSPRHQIVVALDFLRLPGAHCLARTSGLRY